MEVYPYAPHPYTARQQNCLLATSHALAKAQSDIRNTLATRSSRAPHPREGPVPLVLIVLNLRM